MSYKDSQLSFNIIRLRLKNHFTFRPKKSKISYNTKKYRLLPDMGEAVAAVAAEYAEPEKNVITLWRICLSHAPRATDGMGVYAHSP